MSILLPNKSIEAPKAVLVDMGGHSGGEPVILFMIVIAVVMLIILGSVQKHNVVTPNVVTNVVTPIQEPIESSGKVTIDFTWSDDNTPIETNDRYIYGGWVWKPIHKRGGKSCLQKK